MKSFVAISGSASSNSSNTRLLQSISSEFSDKYSIDVLDELWLLPLYSPQLDQDSIPERVKKLRSKLASADGFIISTPEYVHNIPAVLKNMIEWVTTSGELAEKPVLPITFTPAAPRGEYAMPSLLESLKASNSRIVTELPLYRDQMTDEQGNIIIDEEHRFLISEALNLL